MATGSKHKGRKGRIGRNKGRIAVYYNSGRYYWNRARSIIKHVRRYGKKDATATEAMKVLLAAMPLGMQRKFEAAYKWKS